MKKLLWAILSSSSLIPAAFAETPNFLGLGDLPGGAFESRASAVSADGMTVVGLSKSSTFNPTGGDEAFRWSQGQLLGLGALLNSIPSLSNSVATGVNGDGSVIVGDSQQNPSHQTPFIYQSGSMTVGYSENSFAGQMSTNSNWAVTSMNGPGFFGYRARPDGNDSIPILPGGSVVAFGVRVSGISSDGSTVIGRSHAANNLIRPIRWTPSGSTQDLGGLPGTSGCTPTAISGDGSLIVGFCQTSNNVARFKWTPATGMTPLALDFAPIAMSDNGSIMIAGSLLWDANHETRSISDVMTSQGVDMTGWASLDAKDISADGSVIVGSGIHNGQREAFRAYIPEPSSALIFIAGFLLTSRKRKNRI